MSCSIIALDLILLPVLLVISKLLYGPSPRLDRWLQDGVLHLQRRAFEAEGKGLWVNLRNDIPITAHGEKLTELSRPGIPIIEKSSFNKEAGSLGDQESSLKKGQVYVRVYSVQASIRSARSAFGRLTGLFRRKS